MSGRDKIFISYRQDDSAEVAGRIYDGLTSQLSRSSVFIDEHAVQLGADFRRQREEIIAQCSVMLLLIGPHWLSPSEGLAFSVREVIESALRHDVGIIPVLVAGASMPTPEQLPESIRQVALLQSSEVRSAPYFSNDLERLRNALSVPRTLGAAQGSRSMRGAESIAAEGAPDDTPPTPERQAELRAACQANRASGKPPYANTHIRTRGELRWILDEQGWSGEHDAYTVKYLLTPRGEHHEPADLRGANLSHVSLGEVSLRLANLQGANLVFANLQKAHLADARLTEADLGRSNLSESELNYANLAEAHLREVDLHGANLQYANLTGARLHKADLRGTMLHGARMDSSTILSDVLLDQRTWLGDIIWNGVSLARVEWAQVSRLGDEGSIAYTTTRRAKMQAYTAAVRANRQLAIALQEQGLDEEARRFAYRAQTLQRQVLWRQGKFGRWLFSAMLATLAGYGYRIGRILFAYLVVVGLSALAYYLLGAHGHVPQLAPHEALLVSISAFHGRVFAEQLAPGSPQVWIAAFEAVTGLVIEGVFIAMLAQRFFGK